MKRAAIARGALWLMVAASCASPGAVSAANAAEQPVKHPGAAGADADERPQHTVAIAAPFAMSRTEITRGDFRRFVVATDYVAGSACIVWNGKVDAMEDGRDWDNTGFPQTDAHPAACINWHDARAYVGWLAATTGHSYRLPSEAEWEYAARGGTTTDYFWGGSVDDGCAFANAADQLARDLFPDWPVMNCRDGVVHTAPVGSFRPNGFGLFDTAGNVWEWVEDCDHDRYRGAPTDGSAWDGDPGCRRMFRGGSWHFFATSMRSANRHRDVPTVRYFSIGFRIVRDLE